MNQIAQMRNFLLQRRERGRQILASMLNNLKLTFDLLNPVFMDHRERSNVYFLTGNLTIDGTQAAHASLSYQFHFVTENGNFKVSVYKDENLTTYNPSDTNIE